MSSDISMTVTDWLKRGAASDAWAATRRDILENDPSNDSYPQYVERASGAHLWDVEGNRYLDFIMGYGPVVLGHADSRVNTAVCEQLAKGACISPMWTTRQVELAELLVDVIPGAELAYLMRTGSDATSAAVRLARIYTGRTKVAKWGYNGWHDWTAPRQEGVPPSTLAETLRFEYNDIASLERLFAEHPGQIACVIMMPFELEEPRPGFLAEVKALAHRNGAVFILDEMRSGFRMALGGAQEYFGVQADIATYSKAMANGYAISAVVGKQELLKCLGRTHMSSTFFANAPEMAAAIATISVLRESDVIPRLWELGTAFQDGLREIVRTTGLPAEVTGYPIAPFLQFREADDAAASRAKETFYAGTIGRGLLLHPNHQWFLCGAHTRADIDWALEVCAEAARASAA